MLFGSDKLSSQIESHLKNHIHHGKYICAFEAKSVPKPVIMHLFGQYDSQIRRGQKLSLNWNNSQTSFNTQLPQKTNCACNWLTDQLLSTPEKCISWQYEYKGALFRYSFTNYSWKLPTANLHFTNRFICKCPIEGGIWKSI